MTMPLRNSLWAVGGGKGGVGKSLFTLLLATGLARRGVKVVLVDADLGGANLHTLVGIRNPQRGLADFLERRVETLDEVAEQTAFPNLRLINGAEEILGIANPKYAQKTRLLTHLGRLRADAIFLDLGAGTSTTALDFYLFAAGKIAVVTPQVTSIQNAYGFMKASVFRKLARVFSKDRAALELIETASNAGNCSTVQSIPELRKAIADLSPEHATLMNRAMEELQMSLVLNMVREPRERESIRVVSSVAQRYLDITPDVLGYIDYDPELERSVNRMPAYLSSNRQGTAGMGMRDITSKVLQRIRAGSGSSQEPLFEPEDAEAIA